MKRAAIYCRVSSADQRDTGTSLDTQLQRGLQKATQLDWVVPPDFVVREDWTGTDLNRPGLSKMLALARSGALQGIVVYTFDRLFRPENEGDEWRIFPVLAELQQLGVEIAWVDSAVPTQGPFSSIHIMLDSWRAGQERRQILERTQRGKAEKARRGLIVNPRNLPIWLIYNTETKAVELDQEWAQVVRLGFSLVAEEGLTLYKLCARFNELGIPTPNKGSHWRANTLHHWLTNPTAKGVYYQMRYQAVEPRRRRKALTTQRKSKRQQRPSDEWLAVSVPAVVSEELWDRVQRQLERNKALAARNTQRLYLLRGLTTCGESGHRMIGWFKARRYYKCWYNRPEGATIKGDRCTARSANADVLEAAVKDTVFGLLMEPSALQEELRRRKEDGSPTKEMNEQELRTAQKRLTAIPAERDRLVDGYGKGLIPDEAMRVRMDALLEEQQTLEKRIVELERTLARLELTDEQELQVLEFAGQVRQGLDSLDEQKLQGLLHLLVEEVICYSDRVVVKTIIPLPPTSSEEVRLHPNPLLGFRYS